MAKNIIICCDGTDNKLTIGKNTNVIHLYSCLVKNNVQMSYYHPGVGTIAPNTIKNNVSRWLYKLKDTISAGSLEDHVVNAYMYLMEHYEEGDKIYLFGFSRGAYTVRMLSGMIEMFGLLLKGNSGHLQYALEIYTNGDKMFALANTFKSRFSRKVNIEFIGIWDTVVAMGGLINFYKSFPYSSSLGIAKTVRHALAIDERRKHFDYYKVSAAHKDCNEVFFAGVHSDVGGSYSVEGLSKVALEWMLGEASNQGLLLNKEKVDRYVYGKDKKYQKPDYTNPIHNSMDLKNWLSDFIPRLRYKKGNWKDVKLDFRLGPIRFIKDDAFIHESVYQKIEDVSLIPKYAPKNINLNSANYSKVYNQPIVY